MFKRATNAYSLLSCGVLLEPIYMMGYFNRGSSQVENFEELNILYDLTFFFIHWIISHSFMQSHFEAQSDNNLSNENG